MAKNVAIIEAANVDELISQLCKVGFQLECPDSGFAHGFTSKGDGPLPLVPRDVPAFLVEGSGVLLWRGSTESVYVSVVGEKPRVHFNGFTPTEEKALCDSLLQIGVRFSVAFDG